MTVNVKRNNVGDFWVVEATEDRSIYEVVRDTSWKSLFGITLQNRINAAAWKVQNRLEESRPLEDKEADLTANANSYILYGD